MFLKAELEDQKKALFFKYLNGVTHTDPYFTENKKKTNNILLHFMGVFIYIYIYIGG